jgi:uncharacterized protein (TIGR02594 family)
MTDLTGKYAKYAYLKADPQAPRMVQLALEMLGTLEALGAGTNKVIVDWADEIAAATGRTYDKWAADFYNTDSIAWCGLFCAVVATRAAQGRPERLPPNKYLAALEWANWGVAADKTDIQVGDIVVLKRDGGGHVTIAVGVSANGGRFMGLGGNQGDAVTLAEFETARIVAVRRPPYLEKPPGARRVVVASTDPASNNEG